MMGWAITRGTQYVFSQSGDHKVDILCFVSVVPIVDGQSCI